MAPEQALCGKRPGSWTESPPGRKLDGPAPPAGGSRGEDGPNGGHHPPLGVPIIRGYRHGRKIQGSKAALLLLRTNS